MEVIERKLNVEPVRPVQVQPRLKERFCQDSFPLGSLPNIVILARKESGKTNLMVDIMRRYADEIPPERLSVVILSASHNQDPMWAEGMKGLLDQRKIKYFCHHSIWLQHENGTKTNILDDLNQRLRQNDDPQQITIVFLDDMGFSGRSQTVAEDMLKNRHSNLCMITAAQVPTMLHPSVYTNADFVLAMNGCTKKGIDHFHRCSNLLMDADDLWKLYCENTQDQYSFLWIKNANGKEFRRNFDVHLDVRLPSPAERLTKEHECRKETGREAWLLKRRLEQLSRGKVADPLKKGLKLRRTLNARTVQGRRVGKH